jgi:hypothetical protein
MASIWEEEEILEAAVTGIPRVAEAVALIPEKAKTKGVNFSNCASLADASVILKNHLHVVFEVFASTR